MEFVLKDFLDKNRIIPVAEFDSPLDALKTTELLLRNSFPLIEITLRTPSSIESLKKVRREFPGFIIGAGSVLSEDSLKMAADCGIDFAASPAMDAGLTEYSRSLKIPFIPGAATPTELKAALQRGTIVKIFPVSCLGGPGYLRALGAPFAMKEMHLVPTGGITDADYLDYLRTGGVIACGMSFIADRELVRNGEFGKLEARMKRIREGLLSL